MRTEREVTTPGTVRPIASQRARLNSIAAICAVIGLTYVLFRPVSNNLVLYSVFAAIGIIAFLALFQSRRIAHEILVIAFLVAILAVYGMSIGPSNSGLPYTLLVWIVGPILYFACVAAATPFALRAFFWGAALATVAIGALIILFVFGEAGTVPQLIPEWLEGQAGLGATFRDAESQARSFGLSSLNALGPLWAASLTLRRDRFLPPWTIRVICALIALAAAIVSSRSAIMVVMVVSPFVALAVRALIRKRPFAAARVRPLAIGMILAGGAFLSFLLAVLAPRLQSFGPLTTAFQSVSSFFTGASSTAGADESIRTDQAEQLLHAWSQNPIFGSGFGAHVPDYARTSERPWVLELQYHLFLFNVGLVGVAVLVAIGIATIILVRRAVAFAPEFEPTLVVATSVAVSMLIANGTNPYLQAPGHMWAIFLPLAVANVVLFARTPDDMAQVRRTQWLG